MVKEAEEAARRELHGVIQAARQHLFHAAQAKRALLAQIMDAMGPLIVELEVHAAAQRLEDAPMVRHYEHLIEA